LQLVIWAFKFKRRPSALRAIGMAVDFREDLPNPADPEFYQEKLQLGTAQEPTAD